MSQNNHPPYPAQAILPANVKEGISLLNLLLPILSVLLSMAIGVCGGLMLGVIMRPRPTITHEPSSRWVRGREGKDIGPCCYRDSQRVRGAACEGPGVQWCYSSPHGGRAGGRAGDP